MGTHVGGWELLSLSVGIGLLVAAYLALRDPRHPRREEVGVVGGVATAGVALPLALVLAVFGLALLASRRLIDLSGGTAGF